MCTRGLCRRGRPAEFRHHPSRRRRGGSRSLRVLLEPASQTGYVLGGIKGRLFAFRNFSAQSGGPDRRPWPAAGRGGVGRQNAPSAIDRTSAFLCPSGRLYRRPELPDRRRPADRVPASSFPKEKTTMKLLRFGPKGREKPGILDKDGVIRDLSARRPRHHVRDARGRRHRQDPQGQAGRACRRCRKRPASAPASAASAISSPSASTMSTMRDETGVADPQGADRLQQGAELHRRPERRR